MIEKAFKGNCVYWTWMFFLVVISAVGGTCYVRQYLFGLGLTGMGRDLSWGLYISQFTFLVGIAAGGLMLVLPYYIHDYKAFGKLTILGEFLAVASIVMCGMFIMVDLGQPLRGFNVFLHPTPGSMLFWDATVLLGYLTLNIICGWAILTAEKKHVPPPRWVYFLVYLSIPFAVSIHTVTAMLYCGLPGRHLWLSAITAPRFLASAFAAGPALIVIACLIMKKVARFDAGNEAISKLITIIIYATTINAFFVLLEFFVAYYSNVPGHKHPLEYLFFGIEQNSNSFRNLVPFMWSSVILGFGGIGLLVSMKIRNGLTDLTTGIGCSMVFSSLWLDKGLGFVLGGFAITPLNEIVEYYPTANEIAITLGIWAIGCLLVTMLYKIALCVQKEI